MPLLTGCAGHSYEARATVAAQRHCDIIWTDNIRREYATKRDEYLTFGQALGLLHSGMSAADRISYENCLRNTAEREYKTARALGRTCNIQYQDTATYAACYLDKLDAHGYQPRSSGDVHIYQ